MVRKRNRKVAGVGINDSDYCVHISKKIEGKFVKIWRCPYYDKWYNLLMRCYSGNNKSYIGCSVDGSWLYFSNFKKWVEQQPNKDWENCHLDKDLLVEGNKLYSPENCVFISGSVNKFMQDAFSNKRSGGVRGYYFDKRRGKYVSQCANPFTGKTDHVGMFTDEASAHLAWKQKKFEFAKQICLRETDTVIVEALLRKYAP
jgi:hypothetical protein